MLLCGSDDDDHDKKNNLTYLWIAEGSLTGHLSSFFYEREFFKSCDEKKILYLLLRISLMSDLIAQ